MAQGTGGARGGRGDDNDADVALELYKLEYEIGAGRYQSIYQQVWTNFSYLTVVSGGIIAFGSKYLPLWADVLLAVLPLLFWYVAVFTPGNRYGDQVIERLSEVEKILNTLYKGKLVERTELKNTQLNPGVSLYSVAGLKHFTRFFAHQDNPTRLEVWRSKIEPPRVRDTVLISVVLSIIIVVAIIAAASKGKIGGNSEGEKTTVTLNPAQQPLQVRIADAPPTELKQLADENARLRDDVARLQSSLDDIAASLKELKSPPKPRG